jgi:hypothetical protein
MKKFTHGIMVIDPLNPVDVNDENVTVVHFVGYWKKPNDADADRVREELRNDPDFELRDIVDRLVMYPATEGCLKYYNDQAEADGIFNEPNLN